MVKYANTIKNFLVQTQNTILSAAFVISIFYFISAILSIFKSRVIVHYFGASSDLGIFLVADKIPTAIYSTIFLGAFSTVFIPIFLSIYKDSYEKAYQYSSNLLNFLCVVFFVVSLVFFLFSEDVIHLLTFGKATFEERTLGGNLLKIMLVGQLVLIVSSFLTSFLNAKKQFMVTSLAPVLFNLIYLIAIPLLYPFFEIYSLAYAMVVASVFHLLCQLPSVIWSDFKYYPIFKPKDKNIKETISLSGGTLLATIIGNLISIIENSMAFFISSASVVYFKLADQLRYFPIHLFAASISIASLPILSEEIASGNRSRVNQVIKTSLLQILYLSLPVMVLLVVLRLPLVRIFYGADKFTWEDTLITALCLGIFALSILPQSFSIFLSKCFYAMKDTTRPLVASGISLFASIFFPIYFVWQGYGVWVVILSYVVGSYINVVYFFWVMKKYFPEFDFKGFFMSFFKIIMVGVLMSVVLHVPMRLIDLYVLDTSYVLDLLILTGGVGGLGFLVYIFISYKLKIPEITLFIKLLRKLKIRSQALDSLETQLNQPLNS